MAKIRSGFLSFGETQMFLSSFSFAIANVLVKAVSALPVMEVLFFRSIVVAAICAIGIRKARVDWKGSDKKFLILRGFAGSIALICFFTTIKGIPLASATAIQFLSPIFTAIIGVIFLKESVKPLQWLFYAMAFAGVLVINQFDPRVSLLYLAIGVMSAIGSGVAYNIVRRLKDSDHTLVTILYFQVTGVLISLPFLLFEWKMPSSAELFGLLLIGIFSALGQVFLTNAFSRERAARVAIVIYSGLIYAIVLGWVIWGEKQTWQTLLGMVLVVIGVAASIVYGTRHRYRSLEPKVVN